MVYYVWHNFRAYRFLLFLCAVVFYDTNARHSAARLLAALRTRAHGKPFRGDVSFACYVCVCVWYTAAYGYYLRQYFSYDCHIK